MRALWILALLSMGCWAPLGLIGCNTVEGAGEDIEAAGEGIQEGADEVGDEMDDVD